MSGVEVLINIKGIQRDDLGEESSVEHIANGRLFNKEGIFYIIYEDKMLSEIAGTTTSLKVHPDKVILNRMGATGHRQVFEKNKLDESYYVTPEGKMLMGVIPRRVDVNLTDEGGSINLEYELEIGREKISDNKLFISVRRL